MYSLVECFDALQEDVEHFKGEKSASTSTRAHVPQGRDSTSDSESDSSSRRHWKKDLVGDHPEVIDATKAAVALIGNANANAKIPYLRRQKVISQINKALMEDDSNFQDSAPALFGTEFAKNS